MAKGLGCMRLLLLEDEADLAIAIQKTLRSQNYVVDWVSDGKLAWNSLQTINQYQLAILDWMVPEVSGLEICQRLRQQQQTIPVLILTARDRMSDRVAGLDAGADDYLVKPFGMEELLARIRALLRRPNQLKGFVLSIAGLTLNYQTFSVVYNDKTSKNLIMEQSLTAKEFQLLEYFMQHPNQILSQEQIRSRLWGFDDDVISNVVAAQVRLLRRKLETLGDANRIETLRGIGYRFNG
jgi:DNA-binding response OmpR family regulator